MTTNADGPWPIDVEKLKRQALQLETIAKQRAQSDEEARHFYEGLIDLIRLAKAGQISKTVQSVPGEYWFLEGHLARYPDLEAAFAAFSLTLTYGESEQYKKFEKRTEEIRKELFGEN